MRRLLLAPLIAGFFSPAISAPWNQIVEKNNLGEKQIVKDSAVSAIGNNYYHLLKMHQEIIPYLENKIATESKRELKIQRYLCTTRDYIKDVDYCQSKNTKEGMKNILEQIKIDNAYLKEKCPDNNCILDTPHFYKISYQPIFENLNGIKSVGKSQNIRCNNPLISQETRTLWDNALKIWTHGQRSLKTFAQKKYQMDVKVCERHAKF